jgi:3-dehydroquinate synthetase/shikimate kinase
MDIVLVGLPGSGKSVVGKRLANRHAATFIDLDDRIERSDGRRIPTIFAEDGESTFRRLEREAVQDLGPADPDPLIRRVIATGGGAIVDPRNRWALYRGRAVVWLDGRPEVLAQRLRRSPHVRPLVTGRDPIGTIRDLAARRERFYAACDIHIGGVAEVSTVVAAVEAHINDRASYPEGGTVLLSAETAIGRIVMGDGMAAVAIDAALGRLEARRAILISEPGAWNAVGVGLATHLEARGRQVETVLLPEGEAAKRLSVIETAARELARHRISRGEPIVAIGGGALGDAAGFLAATFLRGIPIIHVPTSLVAQIDSAIGGKTAVDLPEGKNLVGAFHQPSDIVIDVSLLATLPERHRRAALGEAVKMAALGDERLFELLETRGDAIAHGDSGAVARGEVAELVERCAWAKVEVVIADERERAGPIGRIRLNLGHSLGHAVEAAGGFEALLHGEAVAYGLRAACRIGEAVGVTPPDRAARIGAVLDSLGLAVEPLPYDIDDVLRHLALDKKHESGRLRWVLPTADGVEVRADVPDTIVVDAAGSLLAAGTAR